LTAAVETWDADCARRWRKVLRGVVLVLAILCLTAAFLLICSCTSGPVVTEKRVWMGGTAMTKTKGYYSKYSGPLGTIEVGTAENDETVIPGKLMNYYGIKAATDGTVALLNQKETTTRVLAKEETSRVGIKSAASVEKLRITTPVP